MIKIFENPIYRNNILIILFLLMVVGDALTKINFQTDFPNPSKFVKAFLLIPLLYFSFKSQKRFILYFFISFALFAVGTLSTSFERLLINIPQFFEYYFFILFFISFKDCNFTKISSVLGLVFLAHALIIIVAAIFEIRFLKTYSNSDRLGYLSLFSSQNEFSYVMMAGLAFFIARFKNYSLLGVIKLAIMLFGALLLGTKSVLLFILLFAFYLLFTRLKPKYFFALILLIASAIFIFWKHLLSFFKSNYNTLYSLYEKEGFISFLSSKRSVLLWDRLTYHQEELTFLNYLFGGYNSNVLFEMSIFDLFYFFGILSLILFGYIIYKFVIMEISLNHYLKAYLTVIIAISFVAGYLFENASAQIYTLLVVLVLSKNYSIASEVERNNVKINP